MARKRYAVYAAKKKIAKCEWQRRQTQHQQCGEATISQCALKLQQSIWNSALKGIDRSQGSAYLESNARSQHRGWVHHGEAKTETEQKP
eukprot:CAMPEP_0119327540 /NCGR_PEP_ID=MMETSP1333-20130426/71041_1 /TAXON_ID=418940 /ORGANISM="Scyphosphaera apsteinii, Strain RCC1455" /LENGTH=88 /DNA_ID=CAMNT_0007336159 /DNA_START=435 /DNA_END=701 /DNA_ORIENTATION=+